MTSDGLWRDGTLDNIVARAIADCLDATGGEVRATARALGISPTTLYRKMAKYGISICNGRVRVASRESRDLDVRMPQASLGKARTNITKTRR